MTDHDLLDPIDRDLRALAIDVAPLDDDTRDRVHTTVMDRLSSTTSGRFPRQRVRPLAVAAFLALGSTAAAGAWWMGVLDDLGCGTAASTAETVATTELSDGRQVELLVFRPSADEPPNGTGVTTASRTGLFRTWGVACNQVETPLSLDPVDGLIVSGDFNDLDDGRGTVYTHGPAPTGSAAVRVTWGDGVETEGVAGDGWWLGVRELHDVDVEYDDDGAYPVMPEVSRLRFPDAGGRILLDLAP